MTRNATVSRPYKPKARSATSRREEGAGGALILSPSSPLKSARAFVDRRYTRPPDRLLHHHLGAFHAWTGTHYPEASETDLRAELYAFLEGARCMVDDGKTAPFHPNRARVGDVLDAVRAVTNLPASMRVPCWLGEAADLPPDEMVAVSNGLLHMPTGDLLPHSPAFFGHHALDFAFDPTATAPNWLDFLSGLWGDDDESIRTLQEIFGYLLTGSTKQQKMFLVVGPKRSGKGSIGRVLGGMLGQDSVVAPTLSGISQNFGLAPLIGKRLAIISDARLGGRADQAVIAERLLSITGEDGITVDRKHRSAWTGRLQTRFVILSNELPRLTDASGALASRFIVLKLTRSFYGQEDHGLTDRLLSELPGVLNWALAGWQRLQERGYFRQPGSALDAIHELEDLASPVILFLRERCIVAPGRQVEIGTLFDAWRTWCAEQGRDHHGTVALFGRDLRAAAPGVYSSYPRNSAGTRSRVYEGIGLQ